MWWSWETSSCIFQLGALGCVCERLSPLLIAALWQVANCMKVHSGKLRFSQLVFLYLFQVTSISAVSAEHIWRMNVKKSSCTFTSGDHKEPYTGIRARAFWQRGLQRRNSQIWRWLLSVFFYSGNSHFSDPGETWRSPPPCQHCPYLQSYILF